MSSESPVVKIEKNQMRLLFPALEVVADCGGETEAATAKRKIGKPEAASKGLRR